MGSVRRHSWRKSESIRSDFYYLADPSRLPIVERVISKITEQFAVVHVHANNHCGVSNYFGLTVPDVLEITFANRYLYELEVSDETFPDKLDSACDPSRPDLWLGYFRY